MKEAKGTARRRPESRRAVDADDAAADLGAERVTTAPRELAKDAAKIWRQIAPDLARLKFLRPTDQLAFARYCEHLALWWSLTRRLRRERLVNLVKSAHVPEGMQRINPHFIVRERIEKRLEVLEDRFGLSPAARQQILQRFAMIAPSMPGELPLGDRRDDAEQPTPAGSPIGLLRSNVTH